MTQHRPEGSADPLRPEGLEGTATTEIGERFPRDSRLRLGGEFRKVFSRGARVVGRHLALHLRRNERASSRLGLAVPRAVGNAVVRNRVKRRLRDIFRRSLRARLDGGPGAHDVVIRALPGAGALSRAELETELFELLARWLSRVRGKRPRRGRPPREGDTPREGGTP